MKEWFGTAARLVTGGVWIWAGAAQAAAPRRRACSRSAPTSCCPATAPRRSATCSRCSRSSSALCLVLGLLTRGAAVRLRAAVRRLHHRHRVGLGARHHHRLRLLRRRRVRPGRRLEVPVGDRPRRRPAAALGVPRLAGPHPARPRQPALPASAPTLTLDLDPTSTTAALRSLTMTTQAHDQQGEAAAARRARRRGAEGEAAPGAAPADPHRRSASSVVIALVVGGGFLINSMRDDTSDGSGDRSPPPGSAFGLTIGSDDGAAPRWSSTRTSSARSAASSRRPATSSWRSWPPTARCRSSTARSSSSTRLGSLLRAVRR